MDRQPADQLGRRRLPGQVRSRLPAVQADLPALGLAILTVARGGAPKPPTVEQCICGGYAQVLTRQGWRCEDCRVGVGD